MLSLKEQNRKAKLNEKMSRFGDTTKAERIQIPSQAELNKSADELSENSSSLLARVEKGLQKVEGK